MRYNAHKLFYRPGTLPCLRHELTITEDQRQKLLGVRRKARAALRAGLRRAGEYLTQAEYSLVRNAPSSAAVNPSQLSFTPKFRTQGSWAYDTLNRPAKRSQQLDLDDGMYIPMSIVGLNPSIASGVLFLISERILGQLCQAEGWTLDTSKSICIRIEVDAECHLDVNIYAIPDQKMVLLEKALVAAASNRAMDSATLVNGPRDLRLDPTEIYVAHRKKGWEQSDPLELEDWFLKAAARHSSWTDLKRITRYLKAWRDERWDACALSSIALMVCAVEALDEANNPPVPGRDDDGLLVVVRALAEKIGADIENPVVTGRLLNDHWTPVEKGHFQLSARSFREELDTALNNEASSDGVVCRIIKLFGPRVPNDASLVAPLASIAAVRSTASQPAPSPRVGSQTSG
jgi:hypothetical protein